MVKWRHAVGLLNTNEECSCGFLIENDKGIKVLHAPGVNKGFDSEELGLSLTLLRFFDVISHNSAVYSLQGALWQKALASFSTCQSLVPSPVTYGTIMKVLEDGVTNLMVSSFYRLMAPNYLQPLLETRSLKSNDVIWGSLFAACETQALWVQAISA